MDKELAFVGLHLDAFIAALRGFLATRSASPKSGVQSELETLNKTDAALEGYGNDSRQSGPLETLPIELLYAHLDASFIFNHLETMNGGPNLSG
jgi:hypothetical protein